MLAVAILASAIAPHDPLKQFREGRTQYGAPVGPSATFRLGTDSRGRDVLSRLVYGARLSLSIGLGGMLVAVGLGASVGLTAGYFGGAVDLLLMRVTDIVMAFPAILLAVAMAAVLPERSVTSLILVIGLINWATPARIVRSETLGLRERLYVDAARVLGGGHLLVMGRHVLPHLVPTLWVVASLGAANTLLLDAGLAFLGIGVPPPAPTWGSMLQDARSWYSVAPWLAIWPGLAVVVTLTGFNLIAFDLQNRLGRP
jgi:ABC-type dipeptide/oligopeptide/nickel transport system permease subunit